MSLTEILAEIPKLSFAERQELVRRAIAVEDAMIQKVIFRPPAVEDVVEAAAWYEAHAAGLGKQLIDEILSATRRAQDGPELFRVVHRDGNVRARSHKSFSLPDLLLSCRRNALRSRGSSRRAARSSMNRAIVSADLFLCCLSPQQSTLNCELSKRWNEVIVEHTRLACRRWRPRRGGRKLSEFYFLVSS
jgi:plasmid stabilization system protein ParE